MKPTRLLLPILIACLPLASCETVNKGYHATARGYHSMTDSVTHTVGGWLGRDNVDKPRETLTPDDICPPVTIDADLRELPQYSDTSHTDPEHLVSNVRIDAATGACTFNEHSVGVALVITMKGTLGPMGRRAPGEKPSFSYPYIVAVMDQHGEVVAEQVFSTTFAYGAGDTELSQVEHVRQIIPLTDHKASEYKLAIGFEIPDLQGSAASASAPALDPAPAPSPQNSIPDLTDTTGVSHQ
jgi:hypothetical protein